MGAELALRQVSLGVVRLRRIGVIAQPGSKKELLGERALWMA